MIIEHKVFRDYPAYPLQHDVVRFWARHFARGDLMGYSNIIKLEQTIHTHPPSRYYGEHRRVIHDSKILFCLCTGLAAASKIYNDTAMQFTKTTFHFFANLLFVDYDSCCEIFTCDLLFSGLVPAAKTHMPSDEAIGISFMVIVNRLLHADWKDYEKEAVCQTVLIVTEAPMSRQTEMLLHYTLYEVYTEAVHDDGWANSVKRFNQFFKKIFIQLEIYFDNQDYMSFRYQPLQDHACSAALAAINWRQSCCYGGGKIARQPSLEMTFPPDFAARQAVLISEARCKMWLQSDSEKQLLALEQSISVCYLLQEKNGKERVRDLLLYKATTNQAELIVNLLAPFIATYKKPSAHQKSGNPINRPHLPGIYF